MHMADALISPYVGGTMYIATGATLAYSIKKVQENLDDRKIPMMGVMGAFVFAAQMINFSIPVTGSSGHIGGGLLLSILLGPYAGFITMAVILAIQALFFADGGLLALGCNIFNLGFYTCFIAYPLIYKKLIKKGYNTKNVFLSTILSVVVGLQLGAFSVVVETILSGKTELPFSTFVLLMQPIHLAIGIVEGVITGSIVLFVYKMKPEILNEKKETIKTDAVKKLVVIFTLLSLIVGGFVSWFASSNPDGLEWSIQKITGSEDLKSKGSLYEKLGKFQEKLSLFPDYQFKVDTKNKDLSQERMGTSTSGIVGAVIVFAFALFIGIIIKARKKSKTT
ncbi:energy-coupling factor ABC transporter permease [Caldicellulosiruptoraceae bacterium PP1]